MELNKTLAVLELYQKCTAIAQEESTLADLNQKVERNFELRNACLQKLKKLEADLRLHDSHLQQTTL